MVKSVRSAWFGMFERVERTSSVSRVEPYPTHTAVVLAEGQLMYVRNASLASAKDLLAAQHAIERRVREERQARLLREATGIAHSATEATR
ncbi:MAG TPA: hypothetical protein VE338_13100 [Ktedonobacterales bacterium]|nr:hypothetical protein [Ktedonobacterales bacterium]